jgi:type IV fimbrial biogenesis protein FimT
MRRTAFAERIDVHPRARRARGFTIVELMITLALLAILIALAAPSFNDASLSGKLGSFASQLVASTQIARSEAVKRNQTVRMCASEDGDACATSGGWEQGWIIVLDDDTVIDYQQALPDEFRIDQAGGLAEIDFPAGVVGATTATFTICRATPVGTQNRVVTLTATGNARVTTTDGVTSCP